VPKFFFDVKQNKLKSQTPARVVRNWTWERANITSFQLFDNISRFLSNV